MATAASDLMHDDHPALDFDAAVLGALVSYLINDGMDAASATKKAKDHHIDAVAFVKKELEGEDAMRNKAMMRGRPVAAAFQALKAWSKTL